MTTPTPSARPATSEPVDAVGEPVLASWRRRVLQPFAAGTRVWLVILGVAAAAGFTANLAWALEAPTDNIGLSVWILIPAFALVESFPIHVQFRSESSSFSLFEIPLVLGIVLADASTLFPAVVLGSTLALVVYRRQPVPKLVFNAANQVLQTATTLLLFHGVGGADDALSPTGSLVILLAAVIGSAVGVSSIAAVIVASERRVELAKTLNMLLFGLIVSAANVSLGVVAALLLDREPWATSLLVIPLAVLYGAYRAFVAERTQREQVEFLYASTKSLKLTDESQSGVSALILEVATMFRAGRVELILFSPGDGVEGPVQYSVDTSGNVSVTPLTQLSDLTATVAAGTDGAVLVGAGSGGDVRKFLDANNIDDAMVAVLRDESHTFGVVVAGDRVGSVANFNEEDLRLFETLCNHAATALENDRLGQALAQLRMLERELSHQATHDTLTGLANRLMLRRHLDRVVAGPDVDSELLFIDLDDFKLVNDTLGHAGGDEVLVEIARRIEACLGPADLAARLGGDEFAVVTDGTKTGASVAKQIIASITRPIRLEGTQINTSCSIGIATATTPMTTEQLLRRADMAMYAAKNDGKGRLSRYHDNLHLTGSALA
jgi:diguanylate cyclase (GGDEF)-like protein